MPEHIGSWHPLIAHPSRALRLYRNGLRFVWLVRRHPISDVFKRASSDPSFRMTVAAPEDPLALAELADRIFRRALFPFPNRCLVKSLAVFSALHPTCPDLKLVIGLRKAPGRSSAPVDGHAWLTLGGRVLSDLDRHAPEAFGATLVLGDDRP